MGWIKSGNHRYYYHAVRAGGKDVVKYWGRGTEALQVAAEVELRKAQRAKVAGLRRRDRALDQEWDMFVSLVYDAIAADLVPKGYRPYGTQWAIVGRGRKSPVQVSDVCDTGPADQVISAFATSLCDQVIARLEGEPEMAARLRRELDELRSSFQVNAGSLEKLMIEQVVVAHAVNMASMWEDSLVPADDLYIAERRYQLRRVNRTNLRLCRSVAGLIGLRKVS